MSPDPSSNQEISGIGNDSGSPALRRDACCRHGWRFFFFSKKPFVHELNLIKPRRAAKINYEKYVVFLLVRESCEGGNGVCKCFIYKGLRLVLAVFKVQMGRQEFKRNVQIERARKIWFG
jgi:hypothetical protein